MIQLPNTLSAWQTPSFESTLKEEIKCLDPAVLPLQEGLTQSSVVGDAPHSAVILCVSEEPEFIRVKAGIFYCGVIAGCSCADDPTPADELTEYCEVQFDIHKTTAETTVALLS